jgi:MscS family membrane protein
MTDSLNIPFPARLFNTLLLCTMLMLPRIEGAAAQSETHTSTAQPEAPSEFASPRDTIRTFVSSMARLKRDPKQEAPWDAVFDALALPSAVGNLRKDVAWKLHAVIDGLALPDAAKLAYDAEEVKKEKLDRFEFFPNNPVAAWRARFQPAVNELGRPPASILLVKGDNGVWRFSSETLGNINRLYSWVEPRLAKAGATVEEIVGSTGVRRLMPEALKGRFVLELELWQWLGLLIVVFLVVVADFAARLILQPALVRLVSRYVGEATPDAVRVAVRPVGLVVAAAAFLLLINLLGLPGMALTIAVVAARLLLIVAGTWSAWAATDLVANAHVRRPGGGKSAFDKMVVPLIRKSIKLFIIALAVIYLADSLDIALAPLLASFGLVGLAISFAAQDTIKNLFGGVTLYVDQPFKVGERVMFRSYDGMIEEIGFRSTKLRTATGHLVTIPNASITTEPVENPARRPYVRRILNVTITYDTPREKIEEAVQIIRNLFEEDGIREPIHPVIGRDAFPPRAYFNEFNSDSLNIFVIYWYAPPAWWDYLDHAQRFNLRLLEEFERAGIEFAFPTRTLYLAGDRKRELALRILGADLESAAVG